MRFLLSASFARNLKTAVKFSGQSTQKGGFASVLIRVILENSSKF
jgi:hypothetical protein